MYPPEATMPIPIHPATLSELAQPIVMSARTIAEACDRLTAKLAEMIPEGTEAPALARTLENELSRRLPAALPEAQQPTLRALCWIMASETVARSPAVAKARSARLVAAHRQGAQEEAEIERIEEEDQELADNPAFQRYLERQRRPAPEVQRTHLA